MAMKSEAAKALRGYRKEVEAQIARAEAKLAELRAELGRIESALTTIGGDGGARPANGTARPAGAANSRVAPATARAPARTARHRRATAEQREQQIVTALADGPLGVMDVAKRLRLGRSRARTLLSELKQRGVLRSEREGKGPRARELYSLRQRTSGSGSSGSSSSRRRAAKST
jgi:DNA-binding transcriptional ArsR family regulator